MHDNRSHPLLQQVPLTVSPFVNLPTATTLPYTYKPMPNTLPPSTAGITAATTDGNTSSSSDGSARPKYVISSSGHAAHPDDIIASCRALQAHIAKLQAEAEAELRALDERARARELAEKRRLAPGWLDSDARLLEPERKSTPAAAPAAASQAPAAAASAATVTPWDGELAAGHDGMVSMEHHQQYRQQQLYERQHQQYERQQYGQSYAARGPSFGQDGHGPGGASEMAVPDEGEELDRAFSVLGLGGQK
ncbi:hypothetical protein B0H63DRAFT_486857 [Podospora didyma]|uniref:Uncharacterized protein n=1 Tax=Podospora didyma TaxID=330526 RepID=A0AAE0K5P2_9PEZI|nr:hypothetical protein B0H63DRAFT_486857 [Podospora didyma]